MTDDLWIFGAVCACGGAAFAVLLMLLPAVWDALSEQWRREEGFIFSDPDGRLAAYQKQNRRDDAA